MSAALYPNVPIAAGVPPVLRLAGAIEGKAVLVAADAVALARMFSGPQWGIFDQSGSSIINADNCIGLDYRKEWRVSDFPTENGGFASYNKVETPYDAKVTFSKSGSTAERTALLNSIQSACDSLNLYTVITPEITYKNANLVHIDYRRTDTNGATLLTVDVWVQEIRASATAQFSQGATPNAQTPAGASQTNGGTVQASPPSGANADTGYADI